MNTYYFFTWPIDSMIMFDLMVIPVTSLTCKLWDSKLKWNTYIIGWNITANIIIYINVYDIFTMIYHWNIPSGCITSHVTGKSSKLFTCRNFVKVFSWALGYYVWKTIKEYKCICSLILHSLVEADGRSNQDGKISFPVDVEY